MKYILLILMLSSCTTINVTSQGDVNIDAHKEITSDTEAGF